MKCFETIIKTQAFWNLTVLCKNMFWKILESFKKLKKFYNGERILVH